ncbi:uncharacterized protein [Clytia hemisphaerica]|uniref:F5/8 type C domain-containing protein n=1 Tax=Clytia hemisphaerica TaxID=252671 RepID=A0A7M5UUD8_9CNID
MFGKGNNTTPWQGRLNFDVPNAPNFGWHVMKERNFLQIDLGTLYKVNAIVIQGASHALLSSQRVLDYSVKYSNDLETWFDVMNEKNEAKKIFPGPENGQLSRSADLTTNKIIGRSFRLIPSDESQNGIMRVEMYGCIAENTLGDQENPKIRSLLINRDSGVIYLCQRNDNRTSCFTSSISSQYRSWKALPKFIVSVTSYDRQESYFGETLTGSLAIKRNSSQIWRDITDQTLDQDKSDDDVTYAFLIKSVLPAIILNENEWSIGKGYSAAVSGHGFYTRYQNDEEWKLVVKWSCCGD